MVLFGTLTVILRNELYIIATAAHSYSPLYTVHTDLYKHVTSTLLAEAAISSLVE